MNDAFTTLYTRVAREVDHDSALERLVEDLIRGSVRHRKDRIFTAAEILEGEDMPGFETPWHYLCQLWTKRGEKREDHIALGERQVRTLITHWCRTNDYGIDLWRKYCEPEEE